MNEFETEFDKIIEDPEVTTSIQRTVGYVGKPGLDLREGFDRLDYENSRLEEIMPRTRKGIQAACQEAYKAVPLVKNTIDLMTDLVIQGIDVVAKTNERFYKKWFRETVNGVDRSERIVSLLYRAGTVIAKRGMGRLNLPRNPEIPIKYTLLNPIAIDVVRDPVQEIKSDENRKYVLTIPDSMNEAMGYSSGWQTHDLRVDPFGAGFSVYKNPATRQLQIPLNRKDISILAYKRDDWEVWGQPICYSILDDLNLMQKMRLADLSALDGAVSKIRLWKLGDLDAKIRPTRAMYAKLADALKRFVPGGVTDIIWGPAIDFKESNSESHHFLGEEKYIIPIKNILFGLGLPNVLHGFGKIAGASNNVVEMRIMVHRLKYVRQLLIQFWRQEFKMLSKAMGFRDVAELVFDVNFLEDESGIYQALLGAIDRNVISHELLQERFGAVPEVEKIRIRRQEKEMQKGKIPPKASPFHEPNLDKKYQQQLMMKLFELGELTDEQVSEIIGEDVRMPKESRPGGEAGPGRPPGSKDAEPRKRRVLKASAVLGKDYDTRFDWAAESLGKILSVFREMKLSYSDPALMKCAFGILTNMQYGDSISTKQIQQVAANNPEIPDEYQMLINSVPEVNEKVLCAAYALLDLQ